MRMLQKRGYVSIHAPREGRDRRRTGVHVGDVVSIHAPREGRDLLRVQAVVTYGKVSIHAPREGRDSKSASLRCTAMRFQSTRPVKGATRCAHPPRPGRRGFNPRAP